jgi:hypothetical protein
LVLRLSNVTFLPLSLPFLQLDWEIERNLTLKEHITSENHTNSETRPQCMYLNKYVRRTWKLSSVQAFQASLCVETSLSLRLFCIGPSPPSLWFNLLILHTDPYFSWIFQYLKRCSRGGQVRLCFIKVFKERWKEGTIALTHLALQLNRQ